MTWARLEQILQPEADRFSAALGNPEVEQRRLLQQILTANRDSRFGREHGFANLADYDDFCAGVPIRPYAGFLPYIESLSREDGPWLTTESPVLLEETGGSSGGPKLIPYTEPGLEGFRRAVFPWLFDLLRNCPGVRNGRWYWSVSPATRQPRRTPSGIAIGLANDAAYLGKEAGAAITPLLAAPPTLAGISDLDAWRFATLRHLLAAADLTLISIWSPTFLLELMEWLHLRGSDWLDNLGVPDWPLDVAPPKAEPLPVCTARRVANIRAALARVPLDTEALWPRLATISCWTDAASSAFVPRVRSLFPHVSIQGKGLLATEGAISLPLCGTTAPVLAVRSGFFEFIAGDGTIRLAHELETGVTYEIVLTTASGLYRYALGDCVEVVGRLEATPLIRFVGRAGLVSDLCGEKLEEAFVLPRLERYPGSLLLAPCLDPWPHYALYCDIATVGADRAAAWAAAVDCALLDNPQYRYARDLGQLSPVRAYLVERLMTRYLDHANQRRQRLGDLKPPRFSADTHWHDRLHPRLI